MPTNLRPSGFICGWKTPLLPHGVVLTRHRQINIALPPGTCYDPGIPKLMRSKTTPLPRLFLALLCIPCSLAFSSCAEVNEANESMYDKIFESSRQRRIAKDTANLKAGRPLQYYHNSREL